MCKRIHRRIQELHLADIVSYQSFLEDHPAEWRLLKELCRVTISRFYRDRQVYETLEKRVFPLLAETVEESGENSLRFWSAGCASGEEPYTLALLWDLRLKSQHPGVDVQILATDVDTQVLQRAEAASYPPSSLRELPEDLKRQGFTFRADCFDLNPAFRLKVIFHKQDLGENLPSGSFHLILCRNLVFTYFEKALQKRIFTAMENILIPGGFLVIGAHENPFPADSRLAVFAKCIYRKEMR